VPKFRQSAFLRGTSWPTGERESPQADIDRAVRKARIEAAKTLWCRSIGSLSEDKKGSPRAVRNVGGFRMRVRIGPFTASVERVSWQRIFAAVRAVRGPTVQAV